MPGASGGLDGDQPDRRKPVSTRNAGPLRGLRPAHPKRLHLRRLQVHPRRSSPVTDADKAPTRIQYDEAGFPKPMGLKKACVKMSLIEAELGKAIPLAKSDAEIVAQIRREIGSMRLTDEEAMLAARVGVFMCSEYERLATANDELVRQNQELERRLLAIHRLAQTETGE